MPYLCVNRDGTEVKFLSKPYRRGGLWESQYYSDGEELPKGTIAKMIDRELTWMDEPYELKEEEV